MKLQFPKENNNKNIDINFSSSKKDINKKLQKEYLNKYIKLYGDSFNDRELIDIFEKNDYNDQKIINDIKTLLSIGNDRKLYEDNNLEEEHHSPSFAHNINSKSNTLKNKKEIFSNESEIPSDYPPPPKEEENTNISNIDNNNLLLYKKFLFNKLKSANNTYKTNKNDKEIINFDSIKRNKIEYNTNKKKEIKLIELYKKNNNGKNISPNPKYQSIEKKNNIPNNNITKEQKKKYIKYFFGNMKNYSKNNIKRDDVGKSPDFGRRKNALHISPDKSDFLEQKVLTYKKGMKIYHSKSKINSSYTYLKICFKVNDIFIPACYDNPQREQLLKMINEKKKQNPDKIIEFIFPQILPMGQIPFYSNLYQPYNQMNPYMNMYIPSPPIQYPVQNSLNNEIINNQSLQNSNNNISCNIAGNINSPILGNSLINNEIMQMNDNQSKNQINNNSNPNSSLINNIGMYNYSNKKSSGNLANSGNINTTSSFK